MPQSLTLHAWPVNTTQLVLVLASMAVLSSALGLAVFGIYECCLKPTLQGCIADKFLPSPPSTQPLRMSSRWKRPATPKPWMLCRL